MYFFDILRELKKSGENDMIETIYRVSSNKFKVEPMETTDKKEADKHDKMLDRAELICESLEKAQKAKELPKDITETQMEDISIHISKNSVEYTAFLRGGKKKQ
jgi:dsDNA-binding SOS-regulon protein